MFLHNEKAESMLSLIQNNSSLEEIPLTAINYIYREANDRLDKLLERKGLCSEIQKHGYMPIAKKRLGALIFKRKVNDTIKSRIKKILKWGKK